MWDDAPLFSPQEFAPAGEPIWEDRWDLLVLPRTFQWLNSIVEPLLGEQLLFNRRTGRLRFERSRYSLNYYLTQILRGSIAVEDLERLPQLISGVRDPVLSPSIRVCSMPPCLSVFLDRRFDNPDLFREWALELCSWYSAALALEHLPMPKQWEAIRQIPGGCSRSFAQSAFKQLPAPVRRYLQGVAHGH